MAGQILLNVLIAMVWLFLSNSWSGTTFVLGYVIGFVLLFLLHRFFPGRFYGKRVVAIVILAGVFIRELLLSTLAVVKLVVQPTLTIRPGIIALPTKLQSSGEVTALAHLITLTPGTLTVAVSQDQSTLYIHAINIEETEEIIKGIQETFEKRIMEVTQ